MDNVSALANPRASGVPSSNLAGAPRTPSSAELSGTELNQDAFLLLMTTQLQNQDPISPMDNDAFLGQLAQFSTVSGIEQMNASLERLVDGSANAQLTDASSMLGRSVLVPGTTARADESGAVRAVATLSAPSEGVTITFTDPITSEVLDIQDVGPRPAGPLDIAWAGLAPDAAPDTGSTGRDVRINVQAGPGVEVDTSVYARIDAVTLGASGLGGLLFSVEDYGLVSELEISSIR